MIGLKLKLFSYIDDILAYKDSLRFELEDAKEAIDKLFSQTFEKKDWFVNYTSRIKDDASLKEKIIRLGCCRDYSDAPTMLGQFSDIIGCRLECRFINDEEKVYKSLFNFFSNRTSEGYYRSDRDPRIELKLDDDQPKSQKNGFSSYRIDGRFLGDVVLNFELQIKSIVNVFWNEIDHKILYKNYNYLITESFVRQIMASIKGDLSIIDGQLEMVYDHLQSLDSEDYFSPQDQLQNFVGRVIQDAYVIPLRDKYNLFFDFRDHTDLLTEFLFARIRYESREGIAKEFIRILEEISRGGLNSVNFGQSLDFDPPIDYHSHTTKKLGAKINRFVNEDLTWNLLACILMDVNTDKKERETFRTFVDYLYFMIIHTIRINMRKSGLDPTKNEDLVDRLTLQYARCALQSSEASYFTHAGMDELTGALVPLLETFKENGDEEGLCGKFAERFSYIEERDKN